MKRTLVRDAINNVGEQASFSGWFHKERKLGGLNFITLRDRTGLIQTLVEEKDEIEKLRGLQVGAVLTIEGQIIKDERAPGGVELHDPKITVLVPVTETPPIEIDKPIDHTPNNLDTLFEYRAISLRNMDEQAAFRVRSKLENAIRQFLTENEFVEMHSPKIVAGAAEGGAEVFELEYYGKQANLAQSPQLYKQMMTGVFERVFEIGQAYRAELSATTRHVAELTMLDIEFGFIKDHEEVLDMVQDMVYYALTNIYEQEADTLKRLRAPELVLKEKFPRFTVEEIHKLYTEATGEDTTQEKDLIPAEERWICEYSKKEFGCEAVFAIDFPIEAMKFYHKINPENPKTVLWGDLLFRGVEIATCPQRENSYEVLRQQMKDAGVDPESDGFKYYLDAFKFGLPAHGGCGFGLDRFFQLTIGFNNVKEAILFPRDINRIAP